MRAEKEQKFISDQFELKEIDHIGFTRPYFRWCRHFMDGQLLRTVDMGLITIDSYDRLIRTPAKERSELYNDNGVLKEGISLDAVFREIEDILK